MTQIKSYVLLHKKTGKLFVARKFCYADGVKPIGWGFLSKSLNEYVEFFHAYIIEKEFENLGEF